MLYFVLDVGVVTFKHSRRRSTIESFAGQKLRSRTLQIRNVASVKGAEHKDVKYSDTQRANSNFSKVSR